ncbi:MAG: hypothetical protein WDN45_10010 [Caulobacteraceae bacterium]
MKDGAKVKGHEAKHKGAKRTKRALLASGLMVAALALLAPPAFAQQSKTTVLVGGMLINGLSAPPLHNAAVVIQGDKIVEVGPAKEVKIPAGATVIDTSGQTMMPGLIEAHGHLFMVGFGDEGAWFKWLASPAGRSIPFNT